MNLFDYFTHKPQAPQKKNGGKQPDKGKKEKAAYTRQFRK